MHREANRGSDKGVSCSGPSDSGAPETVPHYIECIGWMVAFSDVFVPGPVLGGPEMDIQCIGWKVAFSDVFVPGLVNAVGGPDCVDWEQGEGL